jgi:hypothetical protein
MMLSKRSTPTVRDGRIEPVFYPVFPPDTDAGRVIGWLRERSFRNPSLPG